MIKAIVLSLVGAGVLTGCSTVGAKVEKNYETYSTKANDVMVNNYKKVEEPLFKKSNKAFIDKKPLDIDEEKVALPKFFYEKKVGYNSIDGVSLQKIVSYLTKLGVKISLDPELANDGSSKTSANAAVAGLPGLTGDSAGGASAQSPTASNSGSVSNSTGALSISPRLSTATQPVDNKALGVDLGNIKDVVFDGNLVDFLDYFTTKTNLSWKWENNMIVIYKYEVKTFNIDALAGGYESETNISSSGTNGGNDSTTSGSTSQKVNMKMSVEVWNEIDKLLAPLVGPDGFYNMMESSGSVVVKETPAKLKKIESELKKLNKKLSKQVMVNVEIYNVSLKDTANFGLDWSAVWKQAAGKYNIGLSTGGQFTSGVKLTGNITNGPFSGSQIVASALSTLGKASLLTNTSTITLNGHPVPVQVTKETAYLKEVSTTVTDTGTTTELTPGTTTNGFSMNLTPRVTQDNNILLQYSMDLSVLEQIKEFSSGDSTIQLPERTIRNFLQRVSMKSGETLVLSGFQQTSDSLSSSGVGSATNWVLGGKYSPTKENQVLVIAITPYIMK